MGKLIYSMTTSLDGYVSDSKGDISWTQPNEEEFAFINDVQRNIGTFLLGQNMCDTLVVWDTMKLEGATDAVKDFAKIWHAAEKIVYSHTLTEAPIKNAKVASSFDPEKIRELKSQSDKDINIGGPNLAAQAIKAGLVDEYHTFIVPIILGGGNYWLPKDVRLGLKLVDVRSFKNGFVHLQYEPIN
jgi:dihydrofolate reductase